MKRFLGSLLVTCCTVPVLVSAQSSASPVADALRAAEQREARNLVAAAEEMPADKYAYKPTAAQMTVAKVIEHLAEGNDLFCSKIAAVAAPERSKVTEADGKEKLVARLKETFEFCTTALAKVDDSKLGEQMTLFPKFETSRARTILITVGDWEDHYSQLAIYLRLNGLVPPTARRGEG
jgi:uncharacterized damage-inducible protein DinB